MSNRNTDRLVWQGDHLQLHPRLRPSDVGQVTARPQDVYSQQPEYMEKAMAGDIELPAGWTYLGVKQRKPMRGSSIRVEPEHRARHDATGIVLGASRDLPGHIQRYMAANPQDFKVEKAMSYSWEEPEAPEYSWELEKAAGGKKKKIKSKSEVAKEAHEGKDMGKPGPGFDEVAAKASKEYGSAEAGKRVAGAVFQKMRRAGKL